MLVGALAAFLAALTSRGRKNQNRAQQPQPNELAPPAGDATRAKETAIHDENDEPFSGEPSNEPGRR